MSIPEFENYKGRTDRERVVKDVHKFSVKWTFMCQVWKSKDTILTKCESTPTCPHRLLFRLAEGSWTLANEDPGHNHARGVVQHIVPLPPSARVKEESPEREPTRSTRSPTEDDMTGSPAPIDDVPTRTDSPELGPSELSPPRLLKRWATPLPKTAGSTDWNVRSRKRDGPPGLVLLRDMYDQEQDKIPMDDLLKVTNASLSVEDLIQDLDTKSPRRRDNTLPHFFGPTARPFFISDYTSNVDSRLKLTEEAAGYTLQVWDVDANIGRIWTNRQWSEFWNDRKSGRAVVTVSSISHYERQVVNIPDIVRALCWTTLSIGEPHDVDYVMTTADTFSEWHLDLNGLSTWAQVVLGEKMFCCAPPTAANMDAYYRWTLNEDHQLIDLLEGVYYFIVRPNDTLMLPAGTLHCVYSPVKTLMVSGSFASDYDVVTHVITARKEMVIRSETLIAYDSFWTELSDYMQKEIRKTTPSVRLDLLPIVDSLTSMRMFEHRKLPAGFPSKDLVKKFSAAIRGAT